MSNTGNDRIERLWELLGPGVLLPWSAGSKGGNKKWNHRQLADIDDDRHVEPFLEANPLLRHTLRTAAQWGCNIWLRCTSDYPSSCKLKHQSGKEIGEWRADGNQTIIAGTHPTGVPYHFVVEKP